MESAQAATSKHLRLMTIQQLPIKPTREPTWSRLVSKRGRYTHVIKAAMFSPGQGVGRHPSESWQSSATCAARPEGKGSKGDEGGPGLFRGKGACSLNRRAVGVRGARGDQASPGWGETLGPERFEE